MVVIVWLLDVQLHMQSVHITTKVVSSNPLGRGVLDTTLCDKVFSDLRRVGGLHRFPLPIKPTATI